MTRSRVRPGCALGFGRGGPITLAAAALWALLALAGCTRSQGPPIATPIVTAESIAEREAALAALDHYAVTGSFGYWDDVQNLTASIDWQSAPGRLEVSLRAPLGIGRLDVEQRPGAASVRRSGGPALLGERAGPLVQAALGLAAPVPFERLGDWIVGLAGEGATDVERDERGRLRSLVWRDASGGRWRASVRRYREVDGVSLPALLSAVSGERHLRLALADWQLGGQGHVAPALTAPAVPGGAGDATPSPPASPPRRLRLPGA